MATTTIVCAQAIFTSVRTPMGEGYRIIAASRGLRAGDKQRITRNSPSHDSLCTAAAGSDEYAGCAASVYPIGDGRVSVSLSCPAGAEHTGRGGQRVYTHIVVLSQEDLETHAASNPFTVLRAMVAMKLHAPQLNPPGVLDDLELAIDDRPVVREGAIAQPPLTTAWGGHCLESLLDGRKIVVNLAQPWIDSGEAMWLGLPGPMRVRMSLSVGLRFSVGRCHNLMLIHDDQGVTQKRVTGQDVAYLEPNANNEPTADDTPWLMFVKRHWTRGDLTELSTRTARPYSQFDSDGRERIGKIFNEQDLVGETEITELLTIARRRLVEPECKVEAECTADLVTTVQRELLKRIAIAPWQESSAYWGNLVELNRGSEESRLFVRPLIERVFDSTANDRSEEAARRALDLCADDGADWERELIDRVLTRLVALTGDADTEQLATISEVGRRWRQVRPTCPIVDEIVQRCASPAPTNTRV